jgi:3-oxoacyl-[acyl-carrier-protein] synthase-3
MNSSLHAVIVGSGSYIPSRKIPNSHFLHHDFFDLDGKKLEKTNDELITKFKEITGIEERRYVTEDLTASDIGFLAAEQAFKSSHVDKETLDYIIVAHNFGDIRENNRRSESLPSLASRVKQKLDIKNTKTIAYDITFGCAGWLQGMIQANYFIKSGEAKRILVIGAETLSRIADPHDRDSMIYSDGAGAVILEARVSDKPTGILSYHSETFANGIAYVISMDKSNDPGYPVNQLFLKMNGHKLYEYALKLVPQIIKTSIEKAGLTFSNISKLLIHQANQKMDMAILERLAALYGISELPKGIMPMTISWLGNSSVATVPTLYDLVSKGLMENQSIKRNDVLAFAAVGAGVSINSMIYKVPEE